LKVTSEQAKALYFPSSMFRPSKNQLTSGPMWQAPTFWRDTITILKDGLLPSNLMLCTQDLYSGKKP